MSADSLHAYPLKRLDEVAEFLDHLRRDVPEASRRPGPHPYFGPHGEQGTIDAHLFDEPLVLLAEDLSGYEESARPLARLIDGKTWVSTRIHVLRPGPQLDPVFLYRALERVDVAAALGGTKRNRLTRSRAAGLRVPVPSLEDQRRIAAVLGQAHYIRERRGQSRRQLDAFLRIYFLEHFGDPQSNPRRWPRLMFGALGAYEGTLRSLFDSKQNDAAFADERLLVAEDGSNLVGRLQPVSQVVAGKVDGQPHAHVIAANGLADLHYLHHALELLELKPYLTSAIRPRLKRAALERIPVPLPPLEQQHAFRALVEKARAVKALQQASEERLEELYASLRVRALRGDALTAQR